MLAWPGLQEPEGPRCLHCNSKELPLPHTHPKALGACSFRNSAPLPTSCTLYLGCSELSSGTHTTFGPEAHVTALPGGDDLSTGINLCDDPGERGEGGVGAQLTQPPKASPAAAGVLSTLWC